MKKVNWYSCCCCQSMSGFGWSAFCVGYTWLKNRPHFPPCPVLQRSQELSWLQIHAHLWGGLKQALSPEIHSRRLLSLQWHISIYQDAFYFSAFVRFVLTFTLSFLHLHFFEIHNKPLNSKQSSHNRKAFYSTPLKPSNGKCFSLEVNKGEMFSSNKSSQKKKIAAL